MYTIRKKVTMSEFEIRITPEEGMLKEFIHTFKGSLDLRLWMSLIQEELVELRAEDYGTAAHLKELCDVMYVYNGMMLTTPKFAGDLISEEELAKINEGIDKARESITMYFNLYTSEVVGEAFTRVHKSNMSKLGRDGKPIFREDGKVLKGPDYKEPDLSDLIIAKKD
jgi:predicted HAD superfamily Cof-like phosphohydrolase|tara:strand:+ start:170 stop:673 length:504 start_codon:yes stop_codon:yes gene_type:complete